MGRYYDDIYLECSYDQLEHSGILGMKWGIRRYQNEDGTLTEAGKIRYGKLAAKEYYKEHKLSRKRDKTDSFKKAQKIQKKIDTHASKQDRYESSISKDYVNKGRMIVANSKFLNASIVTIASGAAGASTALAGAMLVSAMTGGAAVPAFLGLGATVGATVGANKSDLNYYRKEKNAYTNANKKLTES